MNLFKVMLYLASIGLLGYLVYVIYGYFKGLRFSPRELWLVFTSQLFESVAYMLLNMVVVLFLTYELKLSDVQAGSYVSFWGTAIIIITFFVGALVDTVGIRKMLLYGMVVALVARFFLCFTSNLWAVTLLSFVPLAFSIAVLNPVISVAIKRFTDLKSSPLAFALFATLLHVGTAIGGWLFDKVRVLWGEMGTISVPLWGEMSTYRLMMVICFILTIPAFISVLFIRREEGERVRANSVNFVRAMINGASEKFKESSALFFKVARQRAFWQFLFLLTIMVGVKFVFFHLHYTFPKYGIRILGQGAKIGLLVGVLHPVLITFFIPLTTYLTKKLNAYRAITIGTMISSLSVFMIMIPAKFFAPLLNWQLGNLILFDWLSLSPELGEGVLTLYLAFFFFIVVLSIGEALWSPRLMEYIVQIAPKGQEGSYMALSMLPLFLAKPLVGVISGYLLERYCPAEHSPHHLMVWLWIGIFALITPLGLIGFKKVFKKI